MKRYADEDGHGVIRAIDTPVVSVLARVEVPSALWRKHRQGELDVADTRTLLCAFESDWFGGRAHGPRLHVVGVPPGVLDDAAGLVSSEGLRAYDAVQLAAARAARAADSGCDTFACFDARLRQAAAWAGFLLCPAEGEMVRP